MTSPPGQTIALKRALGLWLLTLYGLGTTIGAGIYVLIGGMAGAAGVHAPVAFLVAAVLVVFTGLSFAELATRFPRAAGESVYVQEAFRSERLALLVGLLTAMAAILSSAAIVNGATGYVQELFPVPRAAILVVLALALTAVAAWGIVESTLVVAIITLMEIGGLLVVVFAGAFGTPAFMERLAEIPPATIEAWSGVLGATMFAFFAFIGFEAMVNLAEEVKDVTRTLPRAIMLTLLVTTLLYGAVATVSVLAVEPAALAASDAPLALVFARATGATALPLSAIAIVATVNGALVMLIMAARITYGLADQGLLPAALRVVDRRTHTPLRATALIGAIVASVALVFPLDTLARFSSAILLGIFALMNWALLALKRRGESAPGALDLPRAVPIAGLCVSVGFLLYEAWSRIF